LKSSTQLRLAATLAIGSWSVAAHAQDPLTAFPKNYSLVLDNGTVEVIRAHYGPHEKIGVHDHSSFPTVFVYLSDSGPVQIEHVEGDKSTVVTRPPTVMGAFRVSPGMAERHRIENPGDTSSDFLRVELKQVSLGILEPFRGKAPPNPLQSQDSIEFTDPSVQIERIVCIDSSACPIKASSAPSLIVAFTPLYVMEGAAEREELDSGAVRWLPASEAAAIVPGAASPAHILRILLPAIQKKVRPAASGSRLPN
jgi:hypothetical protein